MNIQAQVVMTLSQAQWQSLMAICIVAYGSDQLDIQDLALAEEILTKGGAEPDEEQDEEEPDATKH